MTSNRAGKQNYFCSGIGCLSKEESPYPTTAHHHPSPHGVWRLSASSSFLLRASPFHKSICFIIGGIYTGWRLFCHPHTGSEAVTPVVLVAGSPAAASTSFSFPFIPLLICRPFISTKMLEARLQNAVVLKRVFEAMTCLVSEVNLDCDESGLKLQVNSNTIPETQMSGDSLSKAVFLPGYPTNYRRSGAFPSHLMQTQAPKFSYIYEESPCFHVIVFHICLHLFPCVNSGNGSVPRCTCFSEVGRCRVSALPLRPPEVPWAQHGLSSKGIQTVQRPRYSICPK